MCIRDRISIYVFLAWLLSFPTYFALLLINQGSHKTFVPWTDQPPLEPSNAYVGQSVPSQNQAKKIFKSAISPVIFLALLAYHAIICLTPFFIPDISKLLRIFLLLVSVPQTIIALGTWRDLHRNYFRCIHYIDGWITFIRWASLKFWKAFKAVGKPLYDAFVGTCKTVISVIRAVLNLSWSASRFCFKTILSAITFIVKKILATLNFTQGTYVKLLVKVTIMCSKGGLLGDIFLTIFALAWMLWPLYIPSRLDQRIYYIPCGVAAVILSIVGYRAISRTTKN
eukprot:TRINITY_DN8431_c0_g3_i2.p1 TRINITY_DN8431_c0_g3~~TRINITY_DN8431_c0_g3_i2.p1  ORF type:complete len:283 (+),score=31.39 TRINITY_DN8431_c0_g3_i2:66-914(+)